MFRKLNDKEYIIPTSGAKEVEKLINRISAKRDRLIEKGQINESDFIPLKADFHGLKSNTIESFNLSQNDKATLHEQRGKHALLQLEGEVPNVNQWAILGVIEPILGQNDKYTLHSYSTRDLPQVYRDLENPTECEHCDTNRKRNKTFVIKNTETDDVLQVGSSCMKDFISSQSLSMLMSYSNLFKEIAEIGEKAEVQRSVELINKEEFIGTVDAVNETIASQQSIQDDAFNSKRMAQMALLYFDYLDNPSIIENRASNEKELIKNMEVKEHNLDKAEEIVDFFEELDTAQYNDHVFNVTTLVGSDLEFLSEEECLKISDAPKIKNDIEHKTPALHFLLKRPQNGAVIDGKTEILPETIHKEDFIAALNAVSDNDKAYNSYAHSSLSNPGEVDKALFLISDLYYRQHLQTVYQREGEMGVENFKNVMNQYEITDHHYENAQKIIEFFQNNDLSSKSDYQYKMANVIGDTNDEINVKDARYCGYAYYFYHQNQLNKPHQDKDSVDVIKEKQENGIVRFLGAAKDRFEEIELQYTKRNRINSDFGTFYLHQFKDVHGNTFTGTSSKDNPFEMDDENVKFNQWITMAASIKGHRNYSRKINPNINETVNEKQIQLNRIKPVGSFNETPQTDGEPVIKGKYSYGALETVSVKEHDNSFLYEFKDANNKQYSFLTPNALNLDEGNVINAGFQVSGNKTDIFNIDKDSISPANEPSQDFELLTTKQLEKRAHFNTNDNKPQKRPKNN